MDIEKEVQEIERELAMEDARGVKPKDKGAWRWLIGVFLILIFVFYFTADPQVRSVIIGFFESSTLEGNTYVYGEKTIVFEQNTYDLVIDLWELNQAQEIRACLGGKIKGKQYLVDKIILPDIHFQSVYKVISGPCPDDTIIDMHTHPYQKCVGSEQDIKTLESSKKTNPDIIMAVMCTENRMSFYG